MLTDKHIQFLKEKISDLENALFYNYSSSVLKLPVSVVKIRDVDEVGQVWFYINRPSQSLEHFEHEFPANLQFYKKGKKHRMQVYGKAIIVDDPEQLNTLPADLFPARPKNMVLVKVKIAKVDYFEPWDLKKTNWFTTVKNALYKWIYNEEPQYQHQPYGWNTDTAF
jgi:general stress protein 26